MPETSNVNLTLYAPRNRAVQLGLGSGPTPPVPPGKPRTPRPWANP
jgi:hypothetical protein